MYIVAHSVVVGLCCSSLCTLYNAAMLTNKSTEQQDKRGTIINDRCPMLVVGILVVSINKPAGMRGREGGEGRGEGRVTRSYLELTSSTQKKLDIICFK